MEKLATRTAVSIATHRGLTLETLGSVQSCPFKSINMAQGIADVALARCHQIAYAWESARSVSADLVLLIDDDIVFSPVDCERVLAEALELKAAVSARYLQGRPPASQMSIAASPFGPTGRYATGLGFLAMPIEVLAKRIERAAWFTFQGRRLPAITACGPVTLAAPGATGTETLEPAQQTITQWVSEDYEFTTGLGGVHLSKVEVGHVKPVVLLPSMFGVAPPVFQLPPTEVKQ